MKNNLLNVKGSVRNPWMGQISLDAQGHADFTEAVFSVRAAFICFDKKWANGKRTLRAICADWAPADDHQGGDPARPMNDPVDYARFVADKVGLGIDEELLSPRQEGGRWARIAWAMSWFEKGKMTSMEVFWDGALFWREEIGCGG
jgi:hypothetical protein